jgi:hypothetical protein
VTISTYSVGTQGALSGQSFAAKMVTISDPNVRAGGMQQNAQLGQAFVCKNLDGSESYYRLDAERSTPANPVLIRV